MNDVERAFTMSNRIYRMTHALALVPLAGYDVHTSPSPAGDQFHTSQSPAGDQFHTSPSPAGDQVKPTKASHQ